MERTLERASAHPRERLPDLAVAVLAASAFLPVLTHGFVSWDDDSNFLLNRDFQGLAWENIRWAWTTHLLGVYQPLAWLSFELQHALFGLRAGGYHAVSLALHAANAVCLYRLCRSLARTSALPAAIAAALFALHPLRTEAVAWVSCQPYLFAALFYQLAVLRYLKIRAPGDSGPVGARALLPVLALYAVAVLFKAVAVSLPLLLLVLDAYPLQRLKDVRSALRCTAEKLPFLLVAAPAMVLAYLAKDTEHFIPDHRIWGPLESLHQICRVLWFYPYKTVFPFQLSPFYPFPRDFGWLTPSFALSVGATLLAVACGVKVRRRWPGGAAVAVAYAVLLAPCAGFFRLGDQIAADRYSYLASLPWAVGLAGVLAAGLARERIRKLLPAAAAALILILAGLSWNQGALWADSERLWRYIKLHGGEGWPEIHDGLGTELAARHKTGEAEGEFQRAIGLRPDYIVPRNHLAAVYSSQGRVSAAVEQYRLVLQIDPLNRIALNNIGTAMAREGRFREAVEFLGAAVRANPDNELARRNLENANAALAREAARVRANSP